jgi:hypothetical protein
MLGGRMAIGILAALSDIHATLPRDSDEAKKLESIMRELFRILRHGKKFAQQVEQLKQLQEKLNSPLLASVIVCCEETEQLMKG